VTVTARKFSDRQQGQGAPRFTRLERAVMAALAQDLRGQVPDIAAQFERGRPTVRRNSGFGQFTELLVDPHRAAPGGPSGDLGSVHVVIAGLQNPIAFRARVRDGRVMGLLADSYGQDTRAIDFATVAFDQIFTVDADGRSMPFAGASRADRDEPAAVARPAAAPPPVRVPIPASAPPPRSVAPVQPAAPPAASPSVAGLDALFGGPADPLHAAPLTNDEKLSMRIGLWVVLAAAGVVLALIFDIPFAYLIVIGFIAGRYLQTDRGLDLIRQGHASWKKARAEA
jgi:hypothetical protein